MALTGSWMKLPVPPDVPEKAAAAAGLLLLLPSLPSKAGLISLE